MRVRRLAAGTAALLLPFAACSDGDSNAKPSEPTTSSAAPSPSETSTPAPAVPTLPPAARPASPEGAKAFVRFYFGLVTHALGTGDTKPLADYASSKCASCRATQRNIEKVYARGEGWRNYSWKAKQLTEIPDRDPKTISMVFNLHESRGQRVGAEGQVLKRISPRSQPMHVRLVRDDNSWRVDSLDLIRE